MSTFSSEAAYNKCCEAETKHTVHVDPSCTCAPSTEVSEGTVFVLTSPREKGDNSSLICMAFNRREMQRWVSAIGRAIHYSIDSNTAKEILQRHPNSSSSHGSSHVIQSKDGNFDPSALNSLLRRKSLSTIETSAIRQLMVSLKNEKSNSTTSTTSTTTTTTTTTSYHPQNNVKDVSNPLLAGKTDVWYAAFPFSSSTNVNDGEIDLAAGESVLVIERGDALKNEILPNNKVVGSGLGSHGGWWLVENAKQERGRVPSGYLTQDASEIRNFGDAMTSSAVIDCRVSLYSYKAETEKELSFHPGEHMHILERHENGWWLA